MQYYPRLLESLIRSQIKNDSRIIILFGSGQTGKTTLMRAILSGTDNRDLLEVSGEDPAVSELLSSCNPSRMEGLLAGYEFVLIDEAQHVPNIGRALKLLYDADRPGSSQRQIIVTGSSSLSLAKGAREALTGCSGTGSHPESG